MENVYKAFGPESCRYALENINKAVNAVAPSLSRLNLLYGTEYADVTLFIKHFVNYYLIVDRSDKRLDENVCMSVAAIFLGRYGNECTPVKLLCYFANYCEFKDSFREFDSEDIIIQYNKKFRTWWGHQVERYSNITQQPQTIDTNPCGINALKLTVRKWIEDGEDPRTHDLYKYHIVTDEMIEEVEKNITSGISIGNNV